MYRFNIPDSHDWLYFYGVDEKPTPLVAKKSAAIADLVFPDISKEKLIIVNGPLSSVPMVFPENHIIFLSTGGDQCLAQTVFQIGHELCHFYIKANQINNDMFWFEEVLCKVSSHYFLHQYNLHTVWPTDNQTMRYDAYSAMMFKNHSEAFDYKKLIFYDSDVTLYMKNNSIDREKNRFLASLLFPIFLKKPNLFQTLPILRNLYGLKDFRAFLNAWKDSVFENDKVAVQEIINIFL